MIAGGIEYSFEYKGLLLRSKNWMHKDGNCFFKNELEARMAAAVIHGVLELDEFVRFVFKRMEPFEDVFISLCIGGPFNTMAEPCGSILRLQCQPLFYHMFDE